MNTLRRPKT